MLESLTVLYIEYLCFFNIHFRGLFLTFWSRFWCFYSLDFWILVIYYVSLFHTYLVNHSKLSKPFEGISLFHSSVITVLKFIYETFNNRVVTYVSVFTCVLHFNYLNGIINTTFIVTPVTLWLIIHPNIYKWVFITQENPFPTPYFPQLLPKLNWKLKFYFSTPLSRRGCETMYQIQGDPEF